MVASRTNEMIVEHLINGAVDYLIRHGIKIENLTLVWVPSPSELPLICHKLARKGECDGIIALGSVIRGATPQFDHIANIATKGLSQVSLETEIPIGFCLLLTENIEQALERAGGKRGNKGTEAASALVETINVLKKL
jgi:6,7-dimethyl-8-ribityllumazine synthase